MTKQYAITVQNVSKSFTLCGEETMLSRINGWMNGQRVPAKFTALKEISFSMEKGEVLGVIGRNGSGKTTLLRIIAGIYAPTSGNVQVRGRVVPVISLQVGMQQKLTMVDNIFLVGSLFGLSQKEVEHKFEQIVEFSELRDFLNVQLYQFSSGMQARLAFSIAVYMDPEVLLLDEVFQAGDMHFREKSSLKMIEIVHSDATVVFASHQENLILDIADRVLWLDKGLIRMIGKPGRVLDAYRKEMQSRRKRHMKNKQSMRKSVLRQLTGV